MASRAGRHLSEVGSQLAAGQFAHHDGGQPLPRHFLARPGSTKPVQSLQTHNYPAVENFEVVEARVACRVLGFWHEWQR